ncbi:MAG: PEP-CTERM sorting domain-containing protein [Alphaproteobacteria bacterium]|nr:MAG: PEP-CTERM sorting domain-containing protein [Alphaproteobacteria bacterium]
MRHILSAAAAAAFALAIASPAAAIINAPVPTNAYVNFGGLDWAWASPCDASGPNSCGAIDLSYQGTLGWRVAVAADFASGMDYTKFIFAGANVPAGGTEAGTGATFFGGNSADAACASAWFSAYTHCDYGDGAGGSVWNKPDNGSQGDCCHETWVVRDALAVGVPEPQSWTLLIAGFGLVGAAMRRRKTVAA